MRPKSCDKASYIGLLMGSGPVARAFEGGCSPIETGLPGKACSATR